MKLIIDITEEEYEMMLIKQNNNIGSVTSEAEKIIVNGTPFDSVINDVKAEIDEQYDRIKPHNISCAEGLEMALEIIDKHIADIRGDK